MADKKKMSVAEMLAAARKVDSDAAASEESTAEPAAETPDAPAASESVAEQPAAKATPKPVAKPGSADRPSVADMLAMARAGKAGGEQEKAAPKPAAKAAPAAKAKPAAKPAAVKAAAPKADVSRDTASILAAARTDKKPGPMSKAEAASIKPAAGATAVKAKPSIVAPPMPKKPDYAKGKSAKKAKASADGEDRRTMLAVGFTALGGVMLLWTLATVKFMFPNVLRELPSQFKVGPPDAFPAGQVQTKFKAEYGVWVINTEYQGQQELFALLSVCTHLGCTPSWLEAEQKFKCPCHGSGFYKDGVNFEGPAPRPLERCAIQIASDGQVQIDKSVTFQEEMGEWEDPMSYIPA